MSLYWMELAWDKGSITLTSRREYDKEENTLVFNSLVAGK
jgi:hypothetical protein